CTSGFFFYHYNKERKPRSTPWEISRTLYSPAQNMVDYFHTQSKQGVTHADVDGKTRRAERPCAAA
ncbi:MAG: hypothetical protein IJC61_05955, partial [Oscillospiraceae bacterium]|nr:hypothetical protein [Oscillospiraceae bacterium]